MTTIQPFWKTNASTLGTTLAVLFAILHGSFASAQYVVRDGEVRAKCVRDWAGDQNMIEFCEREQNAAITEIRAARRTMIGGPLEDTFFFCERNWTENGVRDFVMISFCIQENLDAGIRLGSWNNESRLPQSTKNQIANSCIPQWVPDYVMVEFCIDEADPTWPTNGTSNSFDGDPTQTLTEEQQNLAGLFAYATYIDLACDTATVNLQTFSKEIMAVGLTAAELAEGTAFRTLVDIKLAEDQAALPAERNVLGCGIAEAGFGPEGDLLPNGMTLQE